MISTYSFSPIFMNNGLFNMRDIHFRRSFCSLMKSYGTISITSSCFQHNLDTCIQISSLEHIGATFLVQQDFVFDDINVFERCVFRSITSAKESSGILFKKNANLKISYCVFIDIIAQYGLHGGTALYVTAGSSIELYCNSFSYCKSAHGASYGIHNNQYFIGIVKYQFNSESYVGYKGKQVHSSFIGGRNVFECYDSNSSYIESSGHSGLFYFLELPTNCETIKRCHFANSVISYLLHMVSPSFTVKNFCFSNISVVEWIAASKSVVFHECSFISVTKNPTWSATYQFIYCEFDQTNAYYSIPSSYATNCLFSVGSPNQYKPSIILQCYGIQPGTDPKSNKAHYFILLIMMFVVQ